MFIGEYFHSIDAKGRVIVPSKYREALGEKFYVTKGFDGNLLVYTLDEWTAFMDKLMKLPKSNAKARAFVRIFSAAAIECEPDNNGRISITPALREFAGLTKDIVSVGSGETIEIWDKARYEEFLAQNSYDEEMLAELKDFGI
jgi:MraZ protein